MFLCLHTEIAFIIVNYLPPKTQYSSHTARKVNQNGWGKWDYSPQEGKVKCVQNIAWKLKGWDSLRAVSLQGTITVLHFIKMGLRRTKCKGTNCTVLTQDRVFVNWSVDIPVKENFVPFGLLCYDAVYCVAPLSSILPWNLWQQILTKYG